jgi:hypothetical protein
MKRANHGTQLKGSDRPQKTPVEAPQTGKNPRDAREERTQQKQNQQELGVGEDHKTKDMESTDRGTFP